MTMRRALPWIGLTLLAISFVWFVRLSSRPVSPPLHARVTAKKKPFVIVLDPGHGGDDSGAICGTMVEKNLTLDVALRADALLRAAGFRTVLTRTDDRYLSLADRAAAANRAEHSLFVSIHFNDDARTAASGVETYFAEHQPSAPGGMFGWLSFLQAADDEPLLSESESLARFLQAALVEHTRAVNRGTKSEQFYVIANVRHPAALVEGGFITNPSDVTKLASADYREQIARAISDGIYRYRQLLQPNEPTLALAAPPSE
ncbi:MAG TPA: N-acetylmuramoyl-L-alanine amidase [Chthoniobacterales bacterium]|jgi:N-acetylmuramoyl-L-alanine amidase